MDSFSLQDKLYDLFVNDPELSLLLNSPQTDEEKNLRVRREEFYIDEIEADTTPFISMIFLSAFETKNYLLNHGVLELCIYTSNRYDTVNIYRQIKRIIFNNFEDGRFVFEGEIPSGVLGINAYRIRLRPIINS